MFSKVWMLAFLSIAACRAPVASHTKAIIDQDERAPTDRFERFVGSIMVDGEAQCTGVAVGTDLVITAAHCFSEAPRSYFFQLANGRTYPVTRIEQLNLRADLAILSVAVGNGLPQGIFESETETEIVSFDLNSQALVRDESRETYAASGLIHHKIDTVMGASGSPLLQNGKVVGIHIGALRESAENLAVRLDQIQEASVENLDFIPERRLRIPSRIGGSIGEAIGAVTNPIRDRVTRPIGELMSEVNAGIVSFGKGSLKVTEPLKRGLNRVAEKAEPGKIDWTDVLLVASIVSNGAACVASDGTSPGVPTEGSSALCGGNACGCAVLSLFMLMSRHGEESDEEGKVKQMVESPEFTDVLSRTNINASVDEAISSLGVGR